MKSVTRNTFCSLLTLLAALSTTSFLGCSETPTASKTNPLVPNSSQAAEPETTSVPATKSTSIGSPAATVADLPDKNAAPEVVCLEFMTLLQQGNRLTAEKLLTRTAFTVTTRADWQLPPIGSSSAEYEIGEVRFATIKQKLAQVDCKVVDKVDGKKEKFDVTWMVRRKKEGWRISGMLIEIDDAETRDLVSFENPADVAMIKESLDSDAKAAADLSANANLVGDQDNDSTETVLR